MHTDHHSINTTLAAPRFAKAENVAATMTSREIAELVGSRHADVMRTIDRLIEKKVVLGCTPSAYTHEQNGQLYAQYHVIKRDSFVVVAQLCPEFTAALVDRWQTLERAMLSQPVQSKLLGEMAILECFTRLLKPAPSSQMMMLSKIAQQNGLDAGFLPGYAVDAAPGSLDGSSMPTKALSALLREHDVALSASAFNQVLKAHGYLKRLTRKNSHGSEVAFWSITDMGMQYGKNLTSPSCPRETQPHWYTERFAELVKRVGGAL